MKANNDPFHVRLNQCWAPPEMITPPPLKPVETDTVEMRYALLINPFYPKDPNASFGKHVLTPTLSLTSFASTTPAQWKLTYWDENLLQGAPPFRPMPQVVGITVHLTFARRAFELADWYRARGSVVVLGGLHVISCPDECEEHADALAIGDGVQLWPRILQDIEAGCLQQRYIATYDTDYSADPLPRREIVPQKSFLTVASLIATRGCHNRCGFCYLATQGLSMPYRMRDPKHIAAEIASTEHPYSVFIDNNLGSRKDYLHALCNELRPLNKIWSAAVSLDVTEDSSLVRSMALAGCTGVFIGFESLVDRNLADARKKTPRVAEYSRSVQLLHDYGIQVNGSFVFGFDNDHKDVFAQTAEWIEENRLECATFHILTPYPSTPLFLQLESQGRLLHRNWDLYDTSHAVFRPLHMTPEELEHGYRWIYQRLFSHASIWRRRPQDWRAVPGYLGMSYLYKRSNRLWHQLIKRRLVSAVWRPLMEVTRWRHLRYRHKLATELTRDRNSVLVVPAGV